MAILLGDKTRGHHQGESRTEPGNGKLQPHGKGHRPPFEPAGDAARHGRSGHFRTQSEKHTARITHRQGMVSAPSQGPKHQPRSEDHHPDEEGAAHPDAPFVQQDTADNEAADDAQDTVSAGVEAVTGRIPTQHRPGRILEEVGDAGEHVVKVVRRKHRYHQTGKGRPREPSR